jgi:endonuclease YncB( thermonuclease family)
MSRLLRFDSSILGPAPAGRRVDSPSGLAGLLAVFVLGIAVGAVFGRAIWNGQATPIRAGVPAQIAPLATGEGQKPGRYGAEVVRVIDGDTFEARVHVWMGQEIVTRVRLRGIDAPERKARCAAEYAQASAATDALRVLLAERDVTIWNVGPDKYFGRVVAQAGTRATPDISAALLARGLVRPYGGGHRNGWC